MHEAAARANRVTDRCGGPPPQRDPLTRLEPDERAELVLDLWARLDLINRTESSQGRDVSLTDGSCALIPGCSCAVILRPSNANDGKDSDECVHRHPHTLKGPRERVWEILTQPSHFESWLPAKPGTAVLDVRTGGSSQATVVSSEGAEIALTGLVQRQGRRHGMAHEAKLVHGERGNAEQFARPADATWTVVSAHRSVARQLLCAGPPTGKAASMPCYSRPSQQPRPLARLVLDRSKWPC